MTKEQKKKIEEIINSYIGNNVGLDIPYLPKDKYKHIKFAITLAKEVFNKEITEEEAEKMLGYEVSCVIVPFGILMKDVFWRTAYLFDIHFNEIKKFKGVNYDKRAKEKMFGNY